MTLARLQLRLRELLAAVSVLHIEARAAEDHNDADTRTYRDIHLVLEQIKAQLAALDLGHIDEP